MQDLFVFVFSFSFIFIIYLIIYFIKLFKGELYKMKEYDLLSTKFNIRKADINYKSVSLVLILVNTFIISLTGTVCSALEVSYLWQMVIGFGLLMAMLIIFYTIIGKILEKKYRKREDY